MQAFLRSKAFDMFVERYTSFGDLNSIEAPLKTLLRVLVPDDKLQVALDLAFAILRMAKRFPVSTPEVKPVIIVCTVAGRELSS